jgi:hypothetical protein
MWLAPSSLDTASVSGEECAIITSALATVDHDWRTNASGGNILFNRYAVAADSIDWGYLSRARSLVPPSRVPPVDLGDCGTLMTPLSDRFHVVTPEHGLPRADRRACWAREGSWVSRPGIDVEHNHAVVLYVDDACGGSGWLLRLTKDADGHWQTSPPDPLWRAAPGPQKRNWSGKFP